MRRGTVHRPEREDRAELARGSLGFVALHRQPAKHAVRAGVVGIDRRDALVHRPESRRVAHAGPRGAALAS